VATDVLKTDTDEAAPVVSKRATPRATWYARADLFAASAIATGAFVLRILLRARVPVEWDSVNLTLGVTHFDVRHDSPHPPGYWLVVTGGRLFHLLGFSPNTSLVIVAALLSSLAAGVCYFAGLRLSGRALGITAAVFVATTPIALFYGTIQNSYAADVLASSLLILLAADARPKGRHHIAAAVIIGLATGFRPSAILMYVPIGLWILWRVKAGRREILQAIAAGLAAIAVWLIPEALQQPGGFGVIWHDTSQLWGNAGERTSVFQGATASEQWHNIVNVATYTFVCVALLAVVIAAAVVFSVVRRRTPDQRPERPLSHGQVLFMLFLAGAPSLAVTLLHFGKAGYILAYLPALVFFLLYLPFELGGWARNAGIVAIAFVAVANVATYTKSQGALPDKVLRHIPVVRDQSHGYPYGVTLNAVRSVEHSTTPWRALAKVLDPAKDRIIFVDSGGAPQRQISWALPQFDMYSYGNGGVGFTFDHTVETLGNGSKRIVIPPGGRAVFVVNVIPSELVQLRDRGLIKPLPLPTGVTAYVVTPQQRVMGVDFVNG
jgi:hypothetical protein